MVDTVLLTGTPSERGGMLGESRAELINAAGNHFKTVCPKNEDWADAALDLSKRLTLLSRYWIMEAQGLTAKVPGLTKALFLAQNSGALALDPWTLPNRFPEYTKTPGCFSAAVSGSSCLSGNAILYFVLESNPFEAHITSRAGTSGTLAYLGLGAGSELGILAFVNEAGLAGCIQPGPKCNNNGSGLRSSFILRAIAERALTVEQAIKNLEEVKSQFNLSMPEGKGTVFTFADVEGNIGIVEATGTNCVHKKSNNSHLVSEGNFQISAQGGGSDLGPRSQKLESVFAEGPVDWQRLFKYSRDHLSTGGEGGENANVSTVFTAILGGSGSSGAAVTAFGDPSGTPAFLSFPEVGVPLPLMDGSVSGISSQLIQVADKSRRMELLQKEDERLTEILTEVDKGSIDRTGLEKAVNSNYLQFLDFVDQAMMPA